MNLDYPGAPKVITRVFLRGWQERKVREGGIMGEAEVREMPFLEGTHKPRNADSF